ncbi:hypothetical protein AB0H43_13405 [Hamadaea sp. NPDC050747]|uniref:hypothetical protein n=1 Tax=Hamadaea sp. NPDC050747 TaxID=3155789 RepID=UPI0033F8FB1E
MDAVDIFRRQRHRTTIIGVELTSSARGYCRRQLWVTHCPCHRQVGRWSVRSWIVEVEYEGLIAEVMFGEGDLLTHVGAKSGWARQDTHRSCFTFDVAARDAVDAFDRVGALAYQAAGVVAARGGPALRPVRMQIGTASDMAMATFGDRVPLVGYADIAELGGFSRQYARQLATKADFPPRVGTVSGAPVYVLSEVETYLRSIGKLANPRENLAWIFDEQVAALPPINSDR